MKLLIYRYKCGTCGEWFEHHGISPSAYGEFLLRSKSKGEERYLNGLTDPVYEEVDRMLSSEARMTSRSDSERADVLQLVFGVACDPSSDGSELQIGRNPHCPQCGVCDIEYWEATEPPRFVEIDVPHVTHTAWNALTDGEKAQALTDALDHKGVK